MPKDPDPNPESPPVHIVTFVTRSGRRCYFASAGTRDGSGGLAPLVLPPQVQVQLDALEARVAWWYFGPPDVCVRGEAAEACSAVRVAEQRGKLVFL